MTTNETHVIVGASLAGAKAAETLREEGFDGRLMLIGDEPERPYERPPLTKDYLRAESPPPPRQRGVEVTVIDPASVPLERVLGPEIGAIYRDVHRDHGVQLMLG